MGNDETSAAVVCDAGPIIHLDQLDCLDLLADFRRVVVPQSVWKEIETHRPSALARQDLNLERVSVDAPARYELTALFRLYSLDAGEAEALLFMGSHRDWILLTDDAAARMAATQLAYEVHGTIGIVIRAIRRGLRSAADVIALLEAIPDRSSLYIKRSLLREIVLSVRESTRNEYP